MPLSSTNSKESDDGTSSLEEGCVCEEKEKNSAETATKTSTDPRSRKRMIANRKERRRTRNLNSAFCLLRHRIPNIPSDTKLPKIKILKMASGYIQYLEDMLQKQACNLSAQQRFQDSKFYINESCESPSEVLPSYEEAVGLKVQMQESCGENDSYNADNTQPLSHYNITFYD